jgi:hypothetical protein
LSGRDEFNSAAGEARRTKAATRARVRQLRVTGLPCYVRIPDRLDNTCE